MPFCPEDSTAIGYIYVVQSAWSNYDFSLWSSYGQLCRPGVPKAAIKAAYEQL